MPTGIESLVPLRLEERGLWNPAEHYWGEEGEPDRGLGEANHRARGPRPEFEMEQVAAGGRTLMILFSDPIGNPMTARTPVIERAHTSWQVDGSLPH